MARTPIPETCPPGEGSLCFAWMFTRRYDLSITRRYIVRANGGDLSDADAAPRVVVDTNVFLSYSSSDYDVAKEVRAILESSGLHVFDDKDMQAGRAWVNEIADAMHSSQVFIAVVSTAYSTSVWAAREWGAALTSGKRVVPLIIERDVRVPALLAPYVGIDVSDSATRKMKLEQLARQISAPIFGPVSLEHDVESTERLLCDVRRWRSDVSALQLGRRALEQERATHIFVRLSGLMLILVVVAAVVVVVPGAVAAGLLPGFINSPAIIGGLGALLGSASGFFASRSQYVSAKRATPEEQDRKDGA